MKNFFKLLFTIFFFSSAFLLGFHFGKEKEKAKIPTFQDDLDRNI